MEANHSQADPAAPQQPRKSGVRRVLAVIAVLIVILLIPPVLNLFAAPAETPLRAAAASGSPAFQKVVAMLERNCMDCHYEKAKLPVYASLPIAKGLIKKDITAGRGDIDLVTDLTPAAPANVTPEAPLAKLEYVVEEGSMPPARYRAMHWNRGLNESQKSDMLGWIRRTRRDNYGTPGVPVGHNLEPIQPLPKKVEVNAAKVALGKQLFHDVRLSGDNTLSCASCHGLDKGGCDRQKSSTGIKGAIGPINSPTVYNAALNLTQFWDGRAADLKQQAAGPVENPIEMGAKWEEVIPKLKADEALMKQFVAVYAAGPSVDTVTDAIAEFERTLITPGSRFDAYLFNDDSAITEEESTGYGLFITNGCYTCHMGKILGGQSFEQMGRRADYFAERGNITEVDSGRFNVTKDPRDRHAFKVPTLRNVAVTYPYFHDGSQTTLEGAVKAMARYQTGKPLTDQEVGLIVKFLGTLTGKYGDKTLE